jgi:hypothetical protein
VSIPRIVENGKVCGTADRFTRNRRRCLEGKENLAEMTLV